MFYRTAPAETVGYPSPPSCTPLALAAGYCYASPTCHPGRYYPGADGAPWCGNYSRYYNYY